MHKKEYKNKKQYIYVLVWNVHTALMSQQSLKSTLLDDFHITKGLTLVWAPSYLFLTWDMKPWLMWDWHMFVGDRSAYKSCLCGKDRRPYQAVITCLGLTYRQGGFTASVIKIKWIKIKKNCSDSLNAPQWRTWVFFKNKLMICWIKRKKSGYKSGKCCAQLGGAGGGGGGRGEGWQHKIHTKAEDWQNFLHTRWEQHQPPKLWVWLIFHSWCFTPRLSPEFSCCLQLLWLKGSISPVSDVLPTTHISSTWTLLMSICQSSDKLLKIEEFH